MSTDTENKEKFVKLTHSEIVTRLREEDAKNKVAHAVFVKLGSRERARGHITLDSLYNAMLLDGFQYYRSDYAKVLEFLASLGFGTLERDKNGDITALVNIDVTIPTIGQVACMRSVNEFKPFKSRKKYKKLTARGVRTVVPTTTHSDITTVPPAQNVAPVNDLNLELTINGQTAKISVPVISLLDKMRSSA